LEGGRKPFLLSGAEKESLCRRSLCGGFLVTFCQFWQELAEREAGLPAQRGLSASQRGPPSLPRRLPSLPKRASQPPYMPPYIHHPEVHPTVHPYIHHPEVHPVYASLLPGWYIPGLCFPGWVYTRVMPPWVVYTSLLPGYVHHPTTPGIYTTLYTRVHHASLCTEHRYGGVHAAPVRRRSSLGSVLRLITPASLSAQS